MAFLLLTLMQNVGYIRHVDPLSPFLIIIALETLAVYTLGAAMTLKVSILEVNMKLN